MGIVGFMMLMVKSIPSDGGSSSIPKALQRAYEGMKRVHPDKGGG